MFQVFVSLDQLVLIASGLIVFLAALIADRLIRRSISKYSTRLGLEKHVENVFKLIARLVVFSVCVVMLLAVFGMPTEWFVGVSALTGAAIGFASTQTVGNFLAGLYIMISRPFMVGDYVKIGEVEGEVREITINYTKVYTPAYNIMELPNRKVLDSTILNCSSKENIIDYSFPIGFPHPEDTTNKEFIDECIQSVLDAFFAEHSEVLPVRPEVSMSKMDRLERQFMIRLLFPEGKIEKFYEIQPTLMQEIVNKWDIFRAEKMH
jgi:small-conductance mechanosensitive channel